MAILQFKIKSEELDSKTDVIVILPTKTVEEMRKLPDYGFYQPDNAIRSSICTTELQATAGTGSDSHELKNMRRITVWP